MTDGPKAVGSNKINEPEQVIARIDGSADKFLRRLWLPCPHPGRSACPAAAWAQSYDSHLSHGAQPPRYGYTADAAHSLAARL